MQDFEFEVSLEGGRKKKITIPAKLMTWTAVRSPGAGGQNVNKVSTKIDLRVEIDSCSALPQEVKQRLRSQFQRYFDQDGLLHVQCAETRSQTRNLELAQEKVGQLIQSAFPRPKNRRATKPTWGSKQRRLDAKSRNSQKKSGRGKVKYD